MEHRQLEPVFLFSLVVWVHQVQLSVKEEHIQETRECQMDGHHDQHQEKGEGQMDVQHDQHQAQPPFFSSSVLFSLVELHHPQQRLVLQMEALHEWES